MFDNFNGDRLAAIEELEAQRNNFWFEMNLYNFLGQLWTGEGYTPALAAEAYWEFLVRARTFQRYAQMELQNADPTRTKDWEAELEDDVKRGVNGVALAQNSWAFAVAQSEEATRDSLASAQEEAASAVRTFYSQLGGYAKEKQHHSVVEILNGLDPDSASTLWMSVDTHAYVVLASAVRGLAADEELGCAAVRLETAKEWHLNRLKQVIGECRSQPACPSLRSTYTGLDSAYQEIVGHLKIIKKALTDSGKEVACREKEVWSLLRPKEN
jgi:hypothetical protein